MERYGWVWVFVGDLPAAERPPIPVLPEVDSPEWRAIYGEFSWNAGWGRVIENGLDIAHAAFVHHDSFGNAEQPVVEHYAVHHEDWGAWAKTCMTPGGRARRRARRGTPPSVQMTLGFELPHLTRLELDFGGNRVILMSANVPIDETRTRTLYLQLRNSFTTPWVDKGAHRRVRRIFEDDRPVVEASRPQRLPALDREVSVPADRLGIAFRRRLQDLYARGWALDSPEDDPPAEAP
jgi:phenylpropionate dioxygenase-like ring-hydroxylating dioxygenase large terminal subunit